MDMDNGEGYDYGSGRWGGWRGHEGEKRGTTVIA